MPYKPSEAQAALDRLGALLSHEAKDEYDAAEVMLREVSRLKPVGGVKISFSENHKMLELQTSVGYRRIWFGGAKRMFLLAHEDQASSTQPLGARIAYDPASGEFVATEYDDSMTPTPGAPRPKRDAVAVLVDAIAAHLMAPARP